MYFTCLIFTDFWSFWPSASCASCSVTWNSSWSFVSLVLSVYWFHYRSTTIHGWGSLHWKNMRQFARLEDNLLETKYTNQCINNVRQTFARLLLFNKNVSLFVKMTFKIENHSADNAQYPARNCVQSIQLGRHSAVSWIWPFSRQRFWMILKTDYQQQFNC